MTYLEIVNEGLRRLREDTVTSVTDTAYSTLIGSFVKQAYIECANAYQWPQFDEQQSVSIVANDSSFSISTNDSGEGVHDVYSVYNSTTESYLISQPYKTVRDHLTEDSDESQPNYYAYAGETSASTTTYYIYPTSDGSYTLKVSYNRKPNLSNTLSDSTFVKLPDLPIVLKAYALAISERGEDGGSLYNETDAAAHSALSDAIANFDSNAGYMNSMWYVV